MDALLARIAAAGAAADDIAAKLPHLQRRGAAVVANACGCQWLRNTPALARCSSATDTTTSYSRALVYEAGGLSEALVRVLFSLDAVQCADDASAEDRATLRAARKAQIVHIQGVLAAVDAAKARLERGRDFVAEMLNSEPRVVSRRASVTAAPRATPLSPVPEVADDEDDEELARLSDAAMSDVVDGAASADASDDDADVNNVNDNVNDNENLSDDDDNGVDNDDDVENFAAPAVPVKVQSADRPPLPRLRVPSSADVDATSHHHHHHHHAHVHSEQREQRHRADAPLPIAVSPLVVPTLLSSNGGRKRVATPAASCAVDAAKRPCEHKARMSKSQRRRRNRAAKTVAARWPGFAYAIAPTVLAL